MTTQAERDKAEAITKLREWIKPGDTVYTVLDQVSRSGMSRHIRVVLLKNGTDLHPNWAVGKALGLRHAKHNGYEQDALVIGGAGMDMGFHLVNNLSYVLYPTYKCVGKARKAGRHPYDSCPSSTHVNSGPDRDKYGAGVTHKDGYALRQRWL